MAGWGNEQLPALGRGSEHPTTGFSAWLVQGSDADSVSPAGCTGTEEVGCFLQRARPLISGAIPWPAVPCTKGTSSLSRVKARGGVLCRLQSNPSPPHLPNKTYSFLIPGALNISLNCKKNCQRVEGCGGGRQGGFADVKLPPKGAQPH